MLKNIVLLQFISFFSLFAFNVKEAFKVNEKTDKDYNESSPLLEDTEIDFNNFDDYILGEKMRRAGFELDQEDSPKTSPKNRKNKRR